MPPPARPPAEGAEPGPAFAQAGFPSELTTDEAEAPASWWASRPLPGVERPEVRRALDLGPEPLAEYLRAEFREGDVLVYLWDSLWHNDDPLMRDPLIGAVSPGDVRDFLPAGRPYHGFGFVFRTGEVYFVNHSSLRGGENEALLRDALLWWGRRGHRIHLVFAALDPLLVPPDPRQVRAEVLGQGWAWEDVWADRTWLVRIDPTRRSGNQVPGWRPGLEPASDPK